MESENNAPDVPMVIKFYRVTSRPNLFMGGDRELVMFSAIVAFGLIFSLQTPASVVVGVVLWMVSLYFLRKMAKYDTHLRHIYLHDIKYERHYYPYTGPKYINTNLQASWYGNPKTIFK